MMNEKEKNVLHDLLHEVIELNTIDKVDAFFEYSGHVDSVSVKVYFDSSYKSGTKTNSLFNKYEYVKGNIKGLVALLDDVTKIEIPSLEDSREKRISELKKEIERLS